MNKKIWQAGLTNAGFFGPLLSARGLQQENNNLKEENQALLNQIQVLTETIKENNLTRELEKNTQDGNFKTILTHLIGLHNDTILIDLGSDDGIAENMPVISANKTLYGRIDKVYKNFASVALISHKNSTVASKIVKTNPGEPIILGAMKGQGNLSMYLDLISSETIVNEGDLVVTSGQEGIFPRDLLLGKIIDATTDDTKPFQTARISAMLDLSKTDTLFIITNYKK